MHRVVDDKLTFITTIGFILERCSRRANSDIYSEVHVDLTGFIEVAISKWEGGGGLGSCFPR